MTKLKDVSIMSLNDGRMTRVIDRFTKGDLSKQEGFSLLVDNNVKDLNPYSRVNDAGKMKVVRAASARQRELLKLTTLQTGNLGSQYIQPSVQLAKASIEGDNSKAYQYVIDHLRETMNPKAGDIGSSANFAPGRLSAAGKGLTLKKDSRFEVDAEEGLLLNGRRFGSLTILEITREVHTGTSTKSALDRLSDFFGIDEEDAPSGKEKLGQMGNFLKGIRNDYEGSDANQFALDACDSLEAAMFTLRDSLADEIRINEKVRESEKAMAKTARRLKSQASIGAEREAITVTDAAGGEEEVS